MNVHHFLVIQNCEGNLYVLITFCSLQVHLDSEFGGIQNDEYSKIKKKTGYQFDIQ